MNTCSLCGDEVKFTQTIHAQPSFPAGARDTSQICPRCSKAVRRADGGACAWCGTDEFTHTVYETKYREADLKLGELCSDCSGL